MHAFVSKHAAACMFLIFQPHPLCPSQRSQSLSSPSSLLRKCRRLLTSLCIGHRFCIKRYHVQSFFSYNLLMSSNSDQSALAADGSPLDSSQIVFFNGPHVDFFFFFFFCNPIYCLLGFVPYVRH